MTRLTLIFVLVAAACGDDDGVEPGDAHNPPDAGTPDAAIDATPMCGTPSQPGPCTIDYDNGNNGSVDKVVTNTWDGMNLVLVEFDDPAGGAIESADSYTYDTLDRITTIEHDTDGDGQANRTEWRTYDAMGRLSHEEFDETGDMVADAVRDHTYDYVTGLETGQTTDIGIDTTIDITATFTYDAAGNLILAEFDYAAVAGDPNLVYAQEYDAMGNLIYRDTDANGDGASDAMETWDYDQLCNIVTYEKTGSGTYTETSTYDADNNLLTEDHDEGSDGSVDIRRVYHYDCW